MYPLSCLLIIYSKQQPPILTCRRLQEMSFPAISGTYRNYPIRLEAAASTDAATRTFSSSFVQFHHSREHEAAVSAEAALAAAAAEDALIKQKEFLPVQMFRRGWGISLLLLLFATLLAVALKRLSAAEAALSSVSETKKETIKDESPPKSAGTPVESPTTRNVRVRLEKLRLLLPGAERLAAAINSVGAATLLQRLQDVVEKAEEVALGGPPGGPVGRTLEDSVTDALAMFQKLHLAAIEEVKKIMQTDGVLYGFGALDGLDKELSERIGGLEQKEDYCVVPLLVKTYKSLHVGAENLRSRLNEQIKQVLTGEQFKDESDEHSLLKTAVTLESINAISRSRRRLAMMAERLENDVVSGLKQTILETREVFIREVEKDLALLNLYAAIPRRLGHRNDDAAAAANAQNVKANLEDFEAQLGKTGLLLDQLCAQVDLIRKSKSLAVIRSADVQAMNLQFRVYASFQECRAKAAVFPELPEHLDSSGRRLVKKFVDTSYHSFVREGLTLLEMLQKLHETKKGGSNGLSSYLNGAIRGQQIYKINKLAAKTTRNLQEANSSWGLVDQATRTDSAMDGALDMSTMLSSLEKDKYFGSILRLNSNFLSFLEEDVGSIVSETESAFSRPPSPLFSEFKPRKYEELKYRFYAAKAAVQNATSLREAASAAIELRLHASSVQDFLYGGEESKQ